MKSILLFLVTILPVFYYAQLSVSIGEHGRAENSHPQLSHVVTGSKHLLDQQLYYFAKVNYQRKHIVWNGFVSFFNEKKAEFHATTWDESGGGSSASYYSSTHYRSILHFSYLAVRFGGDYAFEGKSLLFKKLDASLRFGFFLQLDMPLTFSESNHSKYIYASNNSNADHVFVTTKDETIYESFQSITAKKLVPSLGFNVSKQFTFVHHFFIELHTSAGLHYGSRFVTSFINNNLPEEHRVYYFLEAGLGIGYTFSTKTKHLNQ